MEVEPSEEVAGRALLRKRRLAALQRIERAVQAPSATGVPACPRSLRLLGVGDDMLDLTPLVPPLCGDGAVAAVAAMAEMFPPFTSSYFCDDEDSSRSAPGILDSAAAYERHVHACPVEHAEVAWTKEQLTALRTTAAALGKESLLTLNNNLSSSSVNATPLNWDRILFMPEALPLRQYPPRSPAACRFQWYECVSTLAKRKWTSADDRRLISAATQHDARNWAAIAALVGDGRTPFACFSRYQRNWQRKGRLRRGAWSDPEDTMLLRFVKECGPGDWESIAELFGGTRSGKGCSARWHHLVQQHQKQQPSILNWPGDSNTSSSVSFSTKSGDGTQAEADVRSASRPRASPWTVDENRALTLAVKALGEGDWMSISACVPTRTRDQCKLHWKALKDGASRGYPGPRVWTADNDLSLLQVVRELGSTNWAAVAERMFNSKGAALACFRRWAQLAPASAREASRKRKLKSELLVSDSNAYNKKRRKKKKEVTTKLSLVEVAQATRNGLFRAAALDIQQQHHTMTGTGM